MLNNDNMKLSRLYIICQGLDVILCCFVFFPVMVCYWRGIWDLLEVYMPGEEPLKHWGTLLLGCFSISGYGLHPLLNKHLKRTKKLTYIVITRIYMYLYAVLYMSFWRGVWLVSDYYLRKEWKASLICMLSGQVVLLLLRGFRTVVFPPFIVILDTREDLLKASTRFSTKTSEPLKYAADSCLTHYVIILVTILVWRGAWNVHTALWFPSDKFFADWTSLVIGISCCLILMALEQPLGLVSIIAERRSWYLKLLWEDIFYIFIFIVILFTWRGGWNLNETYLIEDKMVGGWVNHIAGTVGLMSLQLFSYVSSCGCAVDGADPDCQAIYPTKYLREYVFHKIKEKRAYWINTSSEEILPTEIVNTAYIGDSTGGESPSTSPTHLQQNGVSIHI